MAIDIRDYGIAVNAQTKKRIEHEAIDSLLSRLHPSIQRAIRRNLLINIRNAMNYQLCETAEMESISTLLELNADFGTW